MLAIIFGWILWSLSFLFDDDSVAFNDWTDYVWTGLLVGAVFCWASGFVSVLRD